MKIVSKIVELELITTARRTTSLASVRPFPSLTSSKRSIFHETSRPKWRRKLAAKSTFFDNERLPFD